MPGMPLWAWLSVGAAYIVVAFVVWYITYGLTVFMNGGNNVMRTFLKEVTWYVPGGLRRRTAFIKEMIDETLQYPNFDGAICGSKRTWHSREIHEQNLYGACASDVLGSSWEFWLGALVIPLTWPVSVPAVLVLNLGYYFYTEKIAKSSEA